MTLLQVTLELIILKAEQPKILLAKSEERCQSLYQRPIWHQSSQT